MTDVLNVLTEFLIGLWIVIFVVGGIWLFGEDLMAIPRGARAIGEKLGWTVFHAAMKAHNRRKQREAMHALIIERYVKSGDTAGLINYLGAGETISAAGQVIPKPRM